MSPGDKFIILLILAGLAYVFITNIIASPKEHQAGVTFLPNEKFMQVLLSELDKAENDISCALYMFKTDGNSNDSTGLVLSAFYGALERGVSVGVVFDVEKKKDLTTVYNADTGKKLELAGAKVIYDSPDVRLHTKMCVIDKNVTFIGSHNYTHSAMKRNSEVSVRIRSEEIAAEALEYLSGLGL